MGVKELRGQIPQPMVKGLSDVDFAESDEFLIPHMHL